MADFAWLTWRGVDGAPLMARDYHTVGNGRAPVICLHGLTRNSRDFEGVAPWIAQLGRRVLAADVRGRGRSAYAADSASYQPATYAADVLALMDALDIAKAVVIGTSMGGLIAMTLAVVAPTRLAAVVLNDVGPELAPEGVRRISSYAAAFPDYVDVDWLAFARRIFREQGGKPVLDYDPRIMEPFRKTSGKPAPDLWPLFDQLAAGERPLLLVRGALSDLLSASTAEAMRARAPQMGFVEVPRVGHAPMLSEPEARTAIEAFLRGLK
jgi:pimeloyl-ACP methyl ester carboxylesterase